MKGWGEIVGAQVIISAGKLCPHPLLSGDSPCHNTVQVGADTSLIKMVIRETPDHATYRGKSVYMYTASHSIWSDTQISGHFILGQG